MWLPGRLHRAGCQLATAGEASSPPMICWALALIEQLDPTGLNCSGMAMRLAHASGVSGEVTTLLTLVTLAGFSTAGVLLGTTTNQHCGVVGAAAHRLDVLAAAQPGGLQSGVHLEQLLARPVREGAGEVDLVGGGEAEVRVEPERLRLEGLDR